MRAEYVVCIGRCMVERVAALGVPPERIRLAPNWARPLAIDRRQSSPSLRRELGLEDAFVVLYAGNLGVCHDLTDLMTAATRLRALPRLRFLFVGDGSRLAEVRRLADRNRLDNVLWFPPQSRRRFEHFLNLGDLHFVSLAAGFEGLMVPSKAYSSLAAGRPLLYQGEWQGEIARLVREHNLGFVVAPGDGAGLETAILQAMAAPEALREKGLRGRALAERELDSASSLSVYLECLDLSAGRKTR